MKKALIIFLTLLLLAGFLIYKNDFVQKVIYPLEYGHLIKENSKKHSLDPFLVAAVIYEESHFNVKAKSKVGAIGLMQVMPKTAGWISEKINEKKIINNELFIPENNIRYGSWYLRYLIKKYDNIDLALAAYNAGHHNVDKWLKQARTEGKKIDEIKIAFGETRQFVTRVNNSHRTYKRLYRGDL